MIITGCQILIKPCFRAGKLIPPAISVNLVYSVNLYQQNKKIYWPAAFQTGINELSGSGQL
jgi:hypothetical protein